MASTAEGFHSVWLQQRKLRIPQEQEKKEDKQEEEKEYTPLDAFPFMVLNTPILVASAVFAIGVVLVQTRTSLLLALEEDESSNIGNWLSEGLVLTFSRVLELVAWSAFCICGMFGWLWWSHDKRCCKVPAAIVGGICEQPAHSNLQRAVKTQQKVVEEEKNPPGEVFPILLQLPSDCLLRCLAFLRPSELGVMMSVNRYMRYACHTPDLMEGCCFRSLRRLSCTNMQLLGESLQGTALKVLDEEEQACAVFSNKWLPDGEAEEEEAVVLTWKLRSMRLLTLQSAFRDARQALLKSRAPAWDVPTPQDIQKAMMKSRLSFLDLSSMIIFYFLFAWFCLACLACFDLKPLFEPECGQDPVLIVESAEEGSGELVDNGWFAMLKKAVWVLVVIVNVILSFSFWCLEVFFDQWIAAALYVEAMYWQGAAQEQTRWQLLSVFRKIPRMTPARSLLVLLAIRALSFFYSPESRPRFFSFILHTSVVVPVVWTLEYWSTSMPNRKPVPWSACVLPAVAFILICFDVDGVCEEAEERTVLAFLASSFIGQYWRIIWDMMQIFVVFHLGNGVFQIVWLSLGHETQAQNSFFSAAHAYFKIQNYMPSPATGGREMFRRWLRIDWSSRLVTYVLDRKCSWTAWMCYLALHLGAFVTLQAIQLLLVPHHYRTEHSMLAVAMHVFHMFMKLALGAFVFAASWTVVAGYSVNPDAVRQELWYGGVLVALERAACSFRQYDERKLINMRYQVKSIERELELAAHWFEYKRMTSSWAEWEQDWRIGFEALMEPSTHACVRRFELAQNTDGDSKTLITKRRKLLQQQRAAKDFEIAETVVDTTMKLGVVCLVVHCTWVAMASMMELRYRYGGLGGGFEYARENVAYEAGIFTLCAVWSCPFVIVDLSLLLAVMVASSRVVARLLDGKYVLGMSQLRLLGKIVGVAVIYGLTGRTAFATLEQSLWAGLALVRATVLCAFIVRLTLGINDLKYWPRFLLRPWKHGVTLLLGMELVYWACFWLHFMYASPTAPPEPSVGGANFWGSVISLLYRIAEFLLCLMVCWHSISFCVPASNRRMVY